MKLRIFSISLVLAASSLVAPRADAAEVFAKVGTFGAQFLKIGVSARATAMGSAFTAVGDNAEAVYWNPAGIVNVRGGEGPTSRTRRWGPRIQCRWSSSSTD